MTGRLSTFTFAPKWGIYALRIGAHRWVIRSPKCRPLFSERNGLWRNVVSFRGWRLSKDRAA